MIWLRPRAWLLPWLLVGIALLLSCDSVSAQFPLFGQQASGPSYELSDSVQLDEVPSAAKKQFEQVRAFLANEQWSDGVDLLRRIMEAHGDKVVAVDAQRYLNVRDYCQLQLASLPPAALNLYRSVADAQAKQWYDQGLARRDVDLLTRVTSQAFCTRWGDDALFVLGELALEAGELHKARSHWGRLLAEKSRPEGQLTRLVYPDTDIPLADIHARLVLVALLLGQSDRAQLHQQQAGPLLSAASGRLAGRQGNYSELLAALTTSIVPEPIAESHKHWTTFAGSARRQHIASGVVDIDRIEWQQALRYPAPAAEYRSGPRRVGELAKSPLSYHPIVVNERVFVLTKMREDEHDRTKYVQDLQVFDLRTGEPAWGPDHLQLQIGHSPSSHHTAPLGVSRYTLTTHGRKLFARIGNPVTCVHSGNQFPVVPHSIVCLDIEQEGKILWTINPPDEKTAFEGTPICDGAQVFVGLRSGGDVRPQAHVACYDAQTGALRWKRFIASAETPGQGQIDEITNNLLTLDGERVYYNTNLGAVAAIDTRDGHVAWVYRYPRAQKQATFEAPLNFSRDLTPCVVANGRVFVAPNDTNRLFALDAEFGELCWESSHAETAVHLLGVVDGMLVASGDALQFFRAEPKAVHAGDDVATWQHGGKLIGSFADGDKQVGFGRGVIVGQQVYFPTRDAIWVFDTQGAAPRKVRDIELPQTRGAKSGNLVVTDGHLLITTNDEIYAFRIGKGE